MSKGKRQKAKIKSAPANVPWLLGLAKVAKVKRKYGGDDFLLFTFDLSTLYSKEHFINARPFHPVCFPDPFITVADANPGWRAPLVMGWAGMRGVVSLAAALSIPLLINDGQPFPYRNLILFITFIVILVTLVFQGLTLPGVIRKMKIEDRYMPIPEHKQEQIIQKKIAAASLQFLTEKYGNGQVKNHHLNNLLTKLNTDLNFYQQAVEELYPAKENPMSNYQKIYLELLDEQRKLLDKMNHKTEFDEDLIRKYLSLIDLEEFRLRDKQLQETSPTA